MNTEAENSGRAGLPAHERVYRSLRDLILFGGLAPGEPVTIQGLVERLDAGMTPVREALRRLSAEGALNTMGNRRIVVPILDHKAITELTEARLALEPRLAARAAARCSPEGIAQLREIDLRLDQAILNGDVTSYLRENHAFHQHMNQMADAPILTDLVDGLWLRFGPSLRIVCGQMGTRNLPDMHKDLLEALESKNIEAASAAMAGDVSQGMDQIAQSFEQG